jgi:hypothetical protein
MERWRLGELELPPEAHRNFFLDTIYAALVYVAETGTQQDVVRRLLHMAR